MVQQQNALTEQGHAESSQEREASAQDDEPMGNPYEQPSRRGRSQERERNLKMNGSNNAPHQEVQNLHNMILFKMILIKMHKTINKRNHQWNPR